MRRAPLFLLTLLVGLVLALAVVPAGPAAAGSQDDWAITRYDVTAVVQADGSIDVTIDFDFDFAGTPGHGPYLTFVTRQEIDGDPNHYRQLEITDVTAQSTSGAPDDLKLDEGSAGLEIRIGDENIDDVEGVQTYVVTFTINGIINSGAGAAGEDEVFWNVIGSGFEVPLSNVSVQVQAPVASLQQACFIGDVGSTTGCESFTVSGRGNVQFEQPYLDAGDGLTVVTMYPADTFGGAQPILVPRRTLANTMAADPAALGVAGGLALVGVGGVAAIARRRGRDRAYLGLTPGLTPAGDDTAVGWRRRQPIAVQFHPPEDVTPGEVGTLTDEVADPRDVTATIVDLAVRGYFTISEIKTEAAWNYTRNLDKPWSGLRPFEVSLMRGLFPGSSQQVHSSHLGEKFSDAFQDSRSLLYDEMVSQGWFARSPEAVRTSWRLSGVGVILLGLALGIVAGFGFGWGMLGPAVALVGIAVIVCARFAPARTADGTAVLTQALGFRHFIETADAAQLREQAKEDIFSRYLPYAIAFGLEQRWAAIFEELAAQGVPVAGLAWYSGTNAAGLWAGGAFSSSLSDFTTMANAAAAPATSGSSGGSGFSGGFSGGGVGGGGGGGW